MVMKRYGEGEGHPPFRTQRLLTENGQWFFDTREGSQVGPYPDINEVKKALAVFVAQRLLFVQSRSNLCRDFMPGAQDGIEHMVKELYEYYLEYQQNGQTAAILRANQRIRELLRDRESLKGRAERMQALRYALNLEA